MDVTEAIRTAKNYIRTTFEGENLQDIGLEEAEYREKSKQWLITIGFSRPWDTELTSLRILVPKPRTRSYKVVVIDDRTGHVRSVKHREFAS